MRGPDLSGEVLDDRYRILERIAEGAMGVVYRGNRLALDRAVAIKVMHATLPEAMEGKKRFEREAKLMAKLEHPHCVSIIDYGLHGAKPYVVMELVRGQSLFDAIAEGRFEIPRAVDVMRQVLSGLSHAHEQGIIHRDIKPANIMITPKAPLGLHARILDFGLARLMEASTSMSNGVAVGTPSYMAPEQCRGEPIDVRVDIYACGVMLFEMLTGKKPFIAKDPIAIVKKHLEQMPPRLSDVAPGDYGALEGVVARALAKKPADRYPSAVAMADALEAALAGRGTPEATAVLPVTGDPSPASTSIPITVGSSVIEPVAEDVARADTVKADSESTPGKKREPRKQKPKKKTTANKKKKKAAAPKKKQRRARAKAPEADDDDDEADETDESQETDASDGVLAEAEDDESEEETEETEDEAYEKRSRKRPSVNSSIRRMLPPSRTRWLILAVLVFAAASVAAVIVFYKRFASSDESVRGDAAAVLVTSPAPPDAAKHDPVADVIASAAQLKPEAAIDMLGKARRLYPQHAQLALALGKLYFGKMWWNDGLVHLRDAVKLDPTLKSDAELTKLALRAYLTPATHDERLARFVVELGTPMIPLLEETARTHPKPDVKNRAAALRRRIR